MSFANLQTINT